LIKPALKAGPINRFQNAEGADTYNIRGVLRYLKRHLDVALGPKIIYLIGPDVVKQGR
jgi:hypothetical protein